MKKNSLIIILCAIVVVILIGVWYYSMYAKRASTPAAEEKTLTAVSDHGIPLTVTLSPCPENASLEGCFGSNPAKDTDVKGTSMTVYDLISKPTVQNFGIVSGGKMYILRIDAGNHKLADFEAAEFTQKIDGWVKALKQ